MCVFCLVGLGVVVVVGWLRKNERQRKRKREK